MSSDRHFPRRPRVTFNDPIPLTAGGVAIGSVTAELLEAIVNLALDRPVDGAGVPLSTDDVLLWIRASMTPRKGVT